MKTASFRISTVLLLSAFLPSVGLQRAEAGVNVWTTTGPAGGTISALASDPQTPSTLYAGTDSGVFKSVDGAGSWTSTSAGLPNNQFGSCCEAVVTLAIDPQTPTTLYAGLLFNGVFKSTDGGGSWSAANTGLPAPPPAPQTSPVNALVIDPLTPATLYAGGNHPWGVFKSTDGGGSWTAVNAGLTNLNINALAIARQTPTTLYAGTHGSGVFKSTDGGAIWSAINTGLEGLASGVGGILITGLAIDPFVPATVYGATRAGVYVLKQQ